MSVSQEDEFVDWKQGGSLTADGLEEEGKEQSQSLSADKDKVVKEY